MVCLAQLATAQASDLLGLVQAPMGGQISDAADVERPVLAEIRSLELERSAAAAQRAGQLSPAPSSAGTAASCKVCVCESAADRLKQG